MTTILENIKLDENQKPITTEPSGKCDKCGAANVPITRVSAVAGLFFSATATSGKRIHAFAKLLEVVSQSYCDVCKVTILGERPSKKKSTIMISRIAAAISFVLWLVSLIWGVFSSWPFAILAIVFAFIGFGIKAESEDERILFNYVCEQLSLRKQEYVTKYKLYSSIPVFTLADNISLNANDLSDFFKIRSIDYAKEAMLGGFIFDHFGNQWYHRTIEDGYINKFKN